MTTPTISIDIIILRENTLPLTLVPSYDGMANKVQHLTLWKIICAPSSEACDQWVSSKLHCFYPLWRIFEMVEYVCTSTICLSRVAWRIRWCWPMLDTIKPMCHHRRDELFQSISFYFISWSLCYYYTPPTPRMYFLCLRACPWSTQLIGWAISANIMDCANTTQILHPHT